MLRIRCRRFRRWKSAGPVPPAARSSPKPCRRPPSSRPSTASASSTWSIPRAKICSSPATSARNTKPRPWPSSKPSASRVATSDPSATPGTSRPWPNSGSTSPSRPPARPRRTGAGPGPTRSPRSKDGQMMMMMMMMSPSPSFRCPQVPGSSFRCSVFPHHVVDILGDVGILGRRAPPRRPRRELQGSEGRGRRGESRSLVVEGVKGRPGLRWSVGGHTMSRGTHCEEEGTDKIQPGCQMDRRSGNESHPDSRRITG
mmetsp:Transcript_8983/g.22761  ORF Transcript_8983/g.22761 Transcript_8983/m.22761 type:complete len:257 (-) Transcript_8983:25-795(-)